MMKMILMILSLNWVKTVRGALKKVPKGKKKGKKCHCPMSLFHWLLIAWGYHIILTYQQWVWWAVQNDAFCKIAPEGSGELSIDSSWFCIPMHVSINSYSWVPLLGALRAIFLCIFFIRLSVLPVSVTIGSGLQLVTIMELLFPLWGASYRLRYSLKRSQLSPARYSAWR